MKHTKNSKDRAAVVCKVRKAREKHGYKNTFFTLDGKEVDGVPLEVMLMQKDKKEGVYVFAIEKDSL